MTITARYASTCTACGGRIAPGATIEWERGAGSTHLVCPAEPEPVATEELPVPQPTTRPGRMMVAGGLDATITMANGDHVTVYASCIVREDGDWKRVALTDPRGGKVRLASGKRGQRIGWIAGGFAIEWDDGVTEDVKVAVRALFDALTGQGVHELLPSDDELREGYVFPAGDASWTRLQVASACGRCGRKLTDPESIDRGIGPECFSKSTDSHHAAVYAAEPVAVAVDATPAPTAPQTPAQPPMGAIAGDDLRRLYRHTRIAVERGADHHRMVEFFRAGVAAGMLAAGDADELIAYLNQKVGR